MSMKPNMMSNMMLGQMPALDPKLSMLLEHAPRWMANNSLNGLMQPSQFIQPNHMGIPGLIDTGDRNQYNHIDGKSVFFNPLILVTCVSEAACQRSL